MDRNRHELGKERTTTDDTDFTNLGAHAARVLVGKARPLLHPRYGGGLAETISSFHHSPDNVNHADGSRRKVAHETHEAHQ